METLSDNIFKLYKNRILSSFQYQAIILHEKEFIRKLKANFTDENDIKYPKYVIVQRIDKLAGDKLI